MSTAIVRIYTSEGFVVAADGRKGHWESRTVVDDAAQKVFGIRESRRQLAYALSGCVQITPKGSDTIVFDYVSETQKAVAELAECRFRSLWHYADAIKAKLARMPDEATEALATFDSIVPAAIVFLAGYYEGRPKCASIKMFHDGQVPEASVDELDPGHPIGVGSEKVLLALVNRPSFGKYRYPALGVDFDARTLSDGIEIAKSWMGAHCDPEAVEIDPMCWNIGGHVHMCTVTPSQGFQWIVPPGR